MRTQILGLVALLAAGPAFAGGYAVPNTNAKDLGMAGSRVAAQDGPEAVMENPAAMAGQMGLGLSLNGSIVNYGSHWDPPAGATGSQAGCSGGTGCDLISRAAFPPSAYLTYGMKLDNGMPIAVGAGFDVPGGGLVYWPGDFPNRTDAISVDRRTYAMRANAAIEPIRGLKLGGGLLYYRSTTKVRRILDFVSSQGEVQASLAGGAVSWQVAAEYKPLVDVPLTFGVDYWHQGVQHLTGDIHFGAVPPPFQGAATQDQALKADLTFPNTFMIGAAYKPLPELTLTGQFELKRWTVYGQDVGIGQLGSVTIVLPHQFRNGQTYRFGAEYAVQPALRVRAGFLRDVSPQPASTVSSALPDANSWLGSVGVGYDLTPEVELNAAYAYAGFDRITATADAAPGSFKTHAHLGSLMLTYRFGGPASQGSLR